MQQNGWIKLYKKITQWEWYKDVNTYKLFTHLLLTVNNEDSEWRGVKILRGQRVSSLRNLAEECGLTLRQLRTSLAHLKATQEVTQNATHGRHSSFSLFTLKNYSDYQQTDTRSAQKATPIKEEKKKRIKNIISPKGDTAELGSIPDKRNVQITDMITALKGRIGISAFVDSPIERYLAKHCVDLLQRIGKDEFVRRLDILLKDSFHRKNMNKIKYVYNNIKGFIEPNTTESTTAFIS